MQSIRNDSSLGAFNMAETINSQDSDRYYIAIRLPP